MSSAWCRGGIQVPQVGRSLRSLQHGALQPVIGKDGAFVNESTTNQRTDVNFRIIFLKIFFLTLTLIRLILSAAYFHAWVPWAQNLQDFEIPLDTETNGTTHVLVRGPWEQLFRYDMGDKSLAQPPKTSQNRRFAIIDLQIGLIPSPK